MAGRVGDDEVTAVSREVAVGHVDRDPLLPLGGETVEQQCEVQVVALGARRLRVGLERGELVDEQRPRLVEQPPDQRALAVIDAPAHDETQQRLPVVGSENRLHLLAGDGVGRFVRCRSLLCRH